MFCQNCGVEADSKKNFCSSCGAKLVTQQKVGGENVVNREQLLDNSVNQDTDGNNQHKKEGSVFIILGWVFFAISLLFIPIMFGAGAFIMGYLVRKNNNETHGTILMVLAIAGAIFGTLLGIAMY